MVARGVPGRLRAGLERAQLFGSRQRGGDNLAQRVDFDTRQHAALFEDECTAQRLLVTINEVCNHTHSTRRPRKPFDGEVDACATARTLRDHSGPSQLLHEWPRSRQRAIQHCSNQLTLRLGKIALDELG